MVFVQASWLNSAAFSCADLMEHLLKDRELPAKHPTSEISSPNRPRLFPSSLYGEHRSFNRRGRYVCPENSPQVYCHLVSQGCGDCASRYRLSFPLGLPRGPLMCSCLQYGQNTSMLQQFEAENPDSRRPGGAAMLLFRT